MLTYALVSIQRVPGLRVNRPAAAFVGATAIMKVGVPITILTIPWGAGSLLIWRG